MNLPTENALLIRPGLAIPGREVWFEFSHASGPGGQNVNKVATAAALCFCPFASSVLTPEQKQTIRVRCAARINADGVLRITASDTRSQWGNRGLALERFRQILAQALTPLPKRRATRPTKASRERRLADKRARARVKAARSAPVE